MTLIRYMGTKRDIASRVVGLLPVSHRNGAVMDLFSGMGSVASALADVSPVITNDALAFTAVFARSRFLPSRRLPPLQVLRGLKPMYDEHRDWLQNRFAKTLGQENLALNGTRSTLAAHMNGFDHAAKSETVRQYVKRIRGERNHRRYQLASLYYGAGYVSLRQAIQIDAIRYSIDVTPMDVDANWLKAAWLSAAGTVLNAPGHSAQYLKPST